jgi:hypothetical protein
MRRVIAAAAASVAALALFGAASALISNGGFEEGNLDGWMTSIPAGGFIEVVSECLSGSGDAGLCPGEFAPYAPYEGDFFALLKTDGPGSFTVLSREINVSAGETVSGAAFLAEDEDSGYCDSAEVVVTEDGVPTAVFSADACTTGPTAWTPWEYTASSAGTILIEARVTNFNDSIVDSLMGLDGVEDETIVFAQPQRERVNVAGGIAGIFTPSQAIVPAGSPPGTGTTAPISPPSTGAGVTITPPSTGDAGLADRDSSKGYAAAVVVAVAAAACVALKLKVSRA